MSERLSAHACSEAEAQVAAWVGVRKLEAFQPPTSYADESIDDKQWLLSGYDHSVAFYRELIEVEGLTQFRSKLREAEAAREIARNRWSAG